METVCGLGLGGDMSWKPLVAWERYTQRDCSSRCTLRLLSARFVSNVGYKGLLERASKIN